MKRPVPALPLERGTPGRAIPASSRSSRRLPRWGVWLRTLVSSIAALAIPLQAPAEEGDCALVGADCALREVADAVGIWVGAAARTPGEDPEIEAVLVAEFNSLTPENALKWSALASTPGVYDFSVADAIVDLAEEHGMRVRGHTLVWSRLNGIPDWLEAEVNQAPDPAARMQELLAEHIETTVGRYAGRIESWDVVNEPLETLGGSLDASSLFYQTLGPDYLAQAFALAHQADPDARLFLNEVLVELLPAKAAGLLTLVGDLLAQGVPLHGVGLQGHFFFAVPTRQELEATIRSITDLGLEVELTEIDIPLVLFDGAANPLGAQAAAYADVFAACRAVEGCRGLTTWGVSDRSTWLDRAPPWDANAPNRPLLFDDALQPKPAYFAARTAIQVRAVPGPGPWLALGLAALGVALARRLRLPSRDAAKGARN